MCDGAGTRILTLFNDGDDGSLLTLDQIFELKRGPSKAVAGCRPTGTSSGRCTQGQSGPTSDVLSPRQCPQRRSRGDVRWYGDRTAAKGSVRTIGPALSARALDQGQRG